MLWDIYKVEYNEETFEQILIFVEVFEYIPGGPTPYARCFELNTETGFNYTAVNHGE